MEANAFGVLAVIIVLGIFLMLAFNLVNASLPVLNLALVCIVAVVAIVGIVMLAMALKNRE